MRYKVCQGLVKVPVTCFSQGFLQIVAIETKTSARNLD